MPKLSQRLTSHRPRLLGKSPPLGVGEDNAPTAQSLAKQTILGDQIFDHRRLLSVQPTGNYHQQEFQKSRRRSHLTLIFGCSFLQRQP